jgi:hypothetical protein
VKGVRKVHAKWSPVATAWYRILPEVKKSSLTEIQHENSMQLYDCLCLASCRLLSSMRSKVMMQWSYRRSALLTFLTLKTLEAVISPCFDIEALIK